MTMPLIMCKKCGDAVNDIQVHECLPGMQVGDPIPTPTIQEPYPISAPVILPPKRTATKVLDDIREMFSSKNFMNKVSAFLCVCGHSKYHHDCDEDFDGFFACLDCKNCSKYEQVGGGEL